MRVRLLAFATAAEALGAAQAEREVAPGTTLGDLVSELARERPALLPLVPRLALAIDGTLAGPSTPLVAGCEVALLPPVSGG